MLLRFESALSQLQDTEGGSGYLYCDWRPDAKRHTGKLSFQRTFVHLLSIDVLNRQGSRLCMAEVLYAIAHSEVAYQRPIGVWIEKQIKKIVFCHAETCTRCQSALFPHQHCIMKAEPQAWDKSKCIVVRVADRTYCICSWYVLSARNACALT